MKWKSIMVSKETASETQNCSNYTVYFSVYINQRIILNADLNKRIRFTLIYKIMFDLSIFVIYCMTYIVLFIKIMQYKYNTYNFAMQI